MKIQYLLFCITLLLLSHVAQAQLKQPEPELRQRLVKYVADNHLYPGGTYMYFDTVTKKPFLFSPKNFFVEDVSQPVKPAIVSSMPANTNNILGGASNFHLIKDINIMTDAYPANYNSSIYFLEQRFAVLDNVSYFSANDGIHGSELWRSDGTAEGTYLLKDIIPGEASSVPNDIVAAGDKLVFKFRNPVSGKYELWKTNGTVSGTFPILTGQSSFIKEPTSLCNVNGTVFFTLSSSQSNSQLWKTDGTDTGTVLVKDYENENTYQLHSLVSDNGLLFYVAYSTNTGMELYRSDGSESGTYMLKDINPGNNSFSSPSRLTSYQDKLYFAENDGMYNKLWVTDGTTVGTVYASGANNVDITSYGAGLYGYNVPFTISNNVLFFNAYLPTIGYELYKYDAASTEGVVLVKDISQNGLPSIIYPQSIADVNGTVYFSFANDDSIYLYKTNGTETSTVKIKTFTNTEDVYKLYNGNGKLHFVLSNQQDGIEPWVSDGTEEGTVLLKNIYPDSISSYPNYFTMCNGKVLFTATDSLHGDEIWISDGSRAQMLKEINTTTTSGSDPFSIIPFLDGVLAGAYTYEKGYELWKANSSDANLVKDIEPGSRSGFASNFIVKNNTAYLYTDRIGSSIRTQIYKTDGTAEGTLPIIKSQNLSGLLDGFTVTDAGNVYYLLYNYDTRRNEFRKINSTSTEDTLLHSFDNFSSFYADGFTRIFTTIGETIYFSAQDNTTSYGMELWKSDGTADGTTIVKDINTGNGSSSSTLITAFNNQIYFSAYDGSETALWKSDGTEAGTSKLQVVRPQEFEIVNNILFFNGVNNNTDSELWKTDGTTAGTVIVKDIVSGIGGSNPVNLTNVNGTLFFEAADSIQNVQLWKSDGTSSGTQVVKNFASASEGIYLSSFTSAANQLYFLENSKLWVSDGTDVGTGMVSDEVLNNLYISSVVTNGNLLYLNAYNYKYGYELWTGSATQVVLPVTLISFNASLQNADVIAKWSTSAEVNTAYFNVQRSTDAVHFTNAGKVTAKSNSNSLQTYSFPDVNVANLVTARTIYYRLETVDKDGKTSLSKIVPVDLNWKDVVMLLHPNPVKDVVKIRLNNYSGDAVIEVYDLNGKKLKTQQQNIQSGNETSINVSALKAGVYLVKVNLNGKIIQRKFVKE